MKQSISRCLLILLLASPNIQISNQIYINNRFIGHDVLGHGRKNNQFEFNFNDWESNFTQAVSLEHNFDIENVKNSYILDYDVRPWWTKGTTTPKENQNDELTTTPIIYVTITTSAKNPENSGTVQTLTTDLIQTEVTVTNVTDVTTSATIPEAPETTTTTMDTIILTSSTPEDNTDQDMTFPMTITVSELTTLPPTALDYWGIHYPSDMTYPQMGPTNPTVSIPPVGLSNITIPTTKSPVKEEFESDMVKLNAGVFTTFLLHGFKAIAAKDSVATAVMFHSLETEVDELIQKNKLAAFGKSTVAAIVRGVRTLNNVPVDVIKAQAGLGIYIITNRRATLGTEMVSLMDELDNLYIETEEYRVANVVEELHKFPNITKTGREIVHEMIEAVLLAPLRRMYGSEKEKSLVQRLDALVVKLYFGGYTIQRRRGDSSESEETKRTLKSRKTRTTPTPLTAKTKSTIPTTIPNIYSIYSKNETIKKLFKKRMKRYKEKRNPKVWKEWRSKYTTTTTTTERTTRVKRTRKSIYVIKKYVNKTLKKRRRIKIFKNDTGTYKLIIEESDFENDDHLIETPSVAPLHTTGNFKVITRKLGKITRQIKKQDWKYEKQKTMYGKKFEVRSLTDTKSKMSRSGNFNGSRRTLNSNVHRNHRLHMMETSDIPKRFTILNRDKMPANSITIRRFELAKKLTEESSLTNENEEDRLRANLDDALFHEKESLCKYRKVGSESIREFEKKNIRSTSYSDEETVLKSRIYKYFGYDHDFAKTMNRQK